MASPLNFDCNQASVNRAHLYRHAIENCTALAEWRDRKALGQKR